MGKVYLPDKLASFPSYKQYTALTERPRGLPPFEIINGKAMIYSGELFCRHQEIRSDGTSVLCEKTIPYGNVASLVYHVKHTHGIDKAPVGHWSTGTMDRAKAFYDSLPRLREAAEGLEPGQGDSSTVSPLKKPKPSLSESNPFQQMTILRKRQATIQLGSCRRSISPSAQEPSYKRSRISTSSTRVDQAEMDAQGASRKGSEGVERGLKFEAELEKQALALKRIQEEKKQLKALLDIRKQIEEERQEVKRLERQLGR